jgi:glycine/D-amino acid oxidase-like deaminating enzyme
MIPFYDVWDGQGEGGVPWFKDLVQGVSRALCPTLHSLTPSTPQYRSLQPTDNIPAPYGNVYRSYVLHAPLYIIHLSTRLRALGVPIIRQRLTSLDEAYDLSSLGLGQGTVPLVVNATGLGALSLLGVQDDKVYPIRGQTVLVKAPEGWNKVCVMKTQSHPTGDPGEPRVTPSPPFSSSLSTGSLPPYTHTPQVIDSTAPEPSYIIPRPGPTHQVVLGGSFESLSYSTLPSPQLAERILRKAYALQPSLAGPNGSSWRDIEVIAHNVGLRPARRGGCRLELETRVLGGPKPDLWPGKRVNKPKSQVGVVHAYGIGPAG